MPKYAVIFSSKRTRGDKGYGKTAERMLALLEKMPGFCGCDSARGSNGLGVTVSYWSSLNAVKRWKRHPEHVAAQKKGMSTWYEEYSIKICRIEEERRFERGKDGGEKGKKGKGLLLGPSGRGR